jgi:hypothetical protein
MSHDFSIRIDWYGLSDFVILLGRRDICGLMDTFIFTYFCMHRHNLLSKALEDLHSITKEDQQHTSYKYNSLLNTTKANKNDSLTTNRKELDNEEDEDEGLWCYYCLDDPDIVMCAFCGCQVRCYLF